MATATKIQYGARAYINVAGKDFDAVNKAMLAMLANTVCLKSISAMNPARILNRCIGECIRVF